VGIVVGGVVSIGMITAGVALGAQSLSGPIDSLLTQPAIVSVPLAFAAMIAASLATRAPADIGAHMLALHAPEGLGLEALDRARA
jgi:hypothetical protein